MFKKTRSYGPRISLTERQQAAIIARFAAAGLVATIDCCWTGSSYIEVCEAVESETAWGGTVIERGERVAKIRLSGHDEGRRQDSTHACIGSKSRCLEALESYIGEIIADHAATVAA